MKLPPSYPEKVWNSFERLKVCCEVRQDAAMGPGYSMYPKGGDDTANITAPCLRHLPRVTSSQNLKHDNWNQPTFSCYIYDVKIIFVPPAFPNLWRPGSAAGVLLFAYTCFSVPRAHTYYRYINGDLVIHIKQKWKRKT
jgi:hypothetical protein